MLAKPPYYFDTNALWKYYCDEVGSQTIRRLVSTDAPVLVSPLTLLEMVGGLMKHYRCREIKRKKVNAIIKRLRRDAGQINPYRPFKLVGIPSSTFPEAESLLLPIRRLRYSDQ